MALRHRLAAIAICTLMLAGLGIPVALGQEDSSLGLSSSRYIVIDAETGNVFAEHNAHDRVGIASVTKMFTAVQALEMAPLDTVLTTSDFDLRDPDGNYMGSNGTLMGFGVGEQYTLRDLLYGMMLPSGNDAAITIARSLGYQEGDTDQEAVDRFMGLLNQRVADMGLEDTHFVTPSGWGVEGHYSTAADVATFGRLAAQYPVLMEIMGTQSYTTSNGYLTVTNTNRSLNQYPSVFAGKTGYDWEAGYCLINFATREGAGTMIAVNLDGEAPGGWYADSASLLDYGFNGRADLLASGEPFQGVVAAFNDPAPAEIARSTTSTGEFAVVENEQPARQAVEDQPSVPVVAEVPSVEPETIERIARPAIWTAAIAAIGLLGLRGFLTLRDAGSRTMRDPGVTRDAGADPAREPGDQQANPV